MSGFDGWWRISSCGGPSTSHADILKHAVWIGNGQDMWVTRVLRKTQIERLIVGIPVREVSRLKEGINSFPTVYYMPYVVKETVEIWAKECENGVQKKVFDHFLIKTGLKLALPGYDIAGEVPSHSLGWLLLSYTIDDIISAQTTSFVAFFLAFFLVFTQNWIL